MLKKLKDKKLVDKLDELLDFPEFDPHGDIIPNAKGEIKVAFKKTLADVDAGKSCKMMAVKDNPGDNLSGFLKPKKRKAFELLARAEAMRRLDQVGLTKFADEYAGILSGGQRKLLDLSRALMAKPSLLLLDEPFAGVNPTLVEKLLTVLAELRKEQSMTFLLIEHDLETVMNISDRVIVMADGKIIADGLPNSIYENELVIDAYLGSRRKDA
jgi:branched-chain amino acid transport system ATP-binding protein